MVIQNQQDPGEDVKTAPESVVDCLCFINYYFSHLCTKHVICSNKRFSLDTLANQGNYSHLSADKIWVHHRFHAWENKEKKEKEKEEKNEIFSKQEIVKQL